MRHNRLFIGLLFAAILTLLAVPATQAQTCDGGGKNFVDLNGDGFNDNAPDHDNDGIPNGLDPDYVKYAQDGSGYMNQKGKMNKKAYKNQATDQKMNKFQKRNKFQTAAGNMFRYRINASNSTAGTSNGSGTGVCDGSGPQGGSGVCDGTGPHGPKGRN